MTVERIGTNSGHGYAWRRPDGLRARCGGEALCDECRADGALVTSGMDSIPGQGEREPKQLSKTPGLLGLERFVDTAMDGARDEITTLEMAEVIEDLTEKAICDLGGTGRKGMNLLIRVALAAREWQNAAESYDSAAALGTCLDELHEWERSL